MTNFLASFERRDLWPEGYEVEHGFSTHQLEQICSRDFGARESLPFYSSPWLYWESEHYSSGRCLREWLDWPTFLPIPIKSDHGVSHTNKIAFSEIGQFNSHFMTWSKWRTEFPEGAQMERLLIPHPWVSFIHKHAISIRPSASGLLCFIPHEVPGHTYETYDYEEYLASLRSEGMLPRALMLSMHDIHSGLHRKLQSFDIPMLTAGNTRSPRFVERFFDVLTRFERATSNTIGTQIYFSTFIGQEFFIFGKEKKQAGSIISLGLRDENLLREVRHAFSLGSQKTKRERLTEMALSPELFGESKKNQVRRVFRRELINIVPEISRRIVSTG